MFDILLAWLLTWFVHSTVLLGLAWLLDASGLLRRMQITETVWRIAMLGALLTATLQIPVQYWPQREPDRNLQSVASVAPAASATPATHVMTTHAPSLQARTLAGLPVPPAPPAPSAPPAPPALPVPTGSLVVPEASYLPDVAGMWLVPLRQAAPFIFIPWLLLAVLCCMRTAWQVRRLNAATSACPPVTDEGIVRFVATLAERHGRKPPQVRVADCWDSPLVAPNGDICVPSWLMHEMDASKREAVLAHEMAHVVRRDPQWRMSMRMVACAGFLQPLHLVALNRLDVAAELAADAWAAQASGHRQVLAEALFSCAERLHLRNAPAMASPVVNCSSPLLNRIDSLLKGPVMPVSRTVKITLIGGGIATLAAVFALPAIGIIDNSSHMIMRSSANHLTARIDGDFSLTADEKSVASVTGAAVFEQMVDGKTYSIRFEPADQTGVRRIYKIDGKAHAFDAEGQRWLEGAIAGMINETAWHAKERVARLHAEGGNARVLDEVASKTNDFARREYLEALLAFGPLQAAEFNRMLDLAAKMDSDFDRSEIYKNVARNQALDMQQLLTMLGNVDKLGSDFDKHQVLDALSGRIVALLPGAPQLAQAYMATLHNVGSDFERSNALIHFVEGGTLDRDGYDMVLSVAEVSSSDFETCNVLRAVAATMPNDAGLIHHYRKIARKLSDFERGQAEKALDRFES